LVDVTEALEVVELPEINALVVAAEVLGVLAEATFNMRSVASIHP
jgi:hypothetical protein